ncbi:C40 family peptidase [Paenibacillus sedimenti]|uniref:C40 family peptidase n=1 Tax=Paenibacillus sedimenti TaxID=2770274 RepID=A0A926QKD8_9BACL|nr:C40 family peptidase [Paenibacillus sedimenti]MBD0382721.1 C40 family peptidase [Paenibacillus sedimenti]
MWKRLKAAAMGSLVVILATTTGCGNDRPTPNRAAPTASPTVQQGNGNNQTHQMSQEGQGMQMLSTNDAIVPIKAIENVNYVSAPEIIQILNFQSGWDDSNQKLMIGDNDANFELTMNSNKASKEGNEIQVSQPFIKQGDTAYIPVSALGDLFQEDMSFEVKDSQLVIHPTSVATIENEDDPDQQGITAELDFGEDPNDPFKGDEDATNPAAIGDLGTLDEQVWAPSGDEDAVPVLKNIDMNALIRRAKQYLGVKYRFGTGPYSQTGRFDCSTFTQYLFGKQGVKLPRVSRQQAALGTYVSRKNLRKGDLMFFYVPGRFRTNRTVGHVGIYMGNMKMIHSSPKPKNGVQITDINKPYWKKTYLRAKRVAY